MKRVDRFFAGMSFGVFCVLGVSSQALALSGTGQIGDPCPISASGWHQTFWDGVGKITFAQCTTNSDCMKNAPEFSSTDQSKKWSWLVDNIECSNQQKQKFLGEEKIGGCCLYLQEDAPVVTEAISAGSDLSIKDPLGTDSILVLIGRVVQAFIGIAGALALLVFVYAGFVWTTAGGDSHKLEKAQNTMKYAVIGLAILTFAYAIASYAFRAVLGG